MTTLYRPVLIESAEQAEALPGNAVIIEKGPRHIDQAFLRHHALAFAEPYPGEGGAIALVPIEAEEEWTAMGTDDGEHWIAHVGPDGITGSRKDAEQYTKRFGGFITRRYRTPWEEA